MFKGKTPLIVAAVLGVLAALLSYKTIRYHEDQLTKQWELVQVVVANRDLQEGTEVDLDMVAKSYMPKQFVTSNVIRPEQFEKIMGQKLVIPLKSGDPIQWSHFRSESVLERLSSIVRPSGRAISLDIAGSKAVAGWIRPGDHVDILGTFQDPKDTQMLTVTMMQDVVVLATGTITGTTNLQALDKSDRGYANVTLLVYPQDAEILALAAEVGNLRLTLRNPTDFSRFEAPGRTTTNTLLTGERDKEKHPPLMPLLPEIVDLSKGRRQ